MSRTHPLKRLAREQKRDLHRLVSRTEDGVHNAFSYARRSVEPTVGEFARWYGSELARLRADDEAATVPLHWLVSSGWGQRVKSAIGTAAQTAGQQSLGHVTQSQHAAALTGDFNAQALLSEVMQPAITATGWGYVPNAAIQALQARIIGKAGNGGPLGALFDSFGQEASHKAQGVLYTALSSGTNPRQVASQLAGVLDTSRNRALVIAQNELVTAYRNAQLENYRANSDVLDGWMWSAANDACIACIEMDGTVHSLDEDLVDHVKGRCEPLPITKPWSDILGPLGIDSSDLPDTRITTGYQPGAEWFDEQDAETQRDILGPAKYNAMVAGDLDPADLVGVRDDGEWGSPIYEKSLKELGLDASDYQD